MLPSLHSATADSEDMQQNGFCEGVLRQKHTPHHIFGNMHLHGCMRTVVDS